MRVRYLITLLVAGLLITSAAPAEAALKGAGPGCASGPDDVINNAVAGDIFTPLYEQDFGRNVNGAIIKVNMEIEGGWSSPNSDCGGNSTGVFTSRADMLAAGLTYNPADRSGLRADNTNPVFSLDEGVTSLLVRSINALSTDQISGNGGGMRVVGLAGSPKLSGATITIDNSAFRPDFSFSGTLGALGDGGGIYLDLDNGSRLTISDSLFEDLSAGGDGGGFTIVVRGGSTVDISRTTVQRNSAAGDCGGGKIVLENGTITLRGNTFDSNAGAGGTADLCITRPVGSSGAAKVYLLDNSFSASGLRVDAGVSVFTSQVFLPLVRR
ncbi:hypothetical protein K2Z83_21380 [Oscillochloris sp. ZM17-4]|uniref:hypothetical protein n=1 Tax=Oscillochloris sp. ZM17-4 TaxID=2866714 RepID=UPI001C73AC71|nr:hypothetical protein [Oscillochloris sp. ZM17-4]MBX0330225.1 hypothetical protein [Oscillochloris sp. ZM17-4]